LVVTDDAPDTPTPTSSPPPPVPPVVESLPPLRRDERGSRWTIAMETLAGFILVSGGLVPLLLGLGFDTGEATPPLPVLAAATVFIGAVLLLRVLFLRLQGPSRDSRAGRRWVGPTALGAGVVVSLVVVLLSVGVLPGVYYASSGSFQSEINGCGGHYGPARVLVDPAGFPPGAQVQLQWASENGTSIWFTAFQSAPDKIVQDWSLSENGSAGQVGFDGSGGSMWVYALVGAEPCPSRENVQVSWSYSLHL
jgi:hypothetical protein